MDGTKCDHQGGVYRLSNCPLCLDQRRAREAARRRRQRTGDPAPIERFTTNDAKRILVVKETLDRQLAEADALLDDVQRRKLDDDRVRRVWARRDELVDLVEQLSEVLEDHAAVIRSLDDKPIGRYRTQ
jgi:hypothetical protein